jgi:hypothetical protein
MEQTHVDAHLNGLGTSANTQIRAYLVHVKTEDDAILNWMGMATPCITATARFHMGATTVKKCMQQNAECGVTHITLRLTGCNMVIKGPADKSWRKLVQTSGL